MGIFDVEPAKRLYGSFRSIHVEEILLSHHLDGLSQVGEGDAVSFLFCKCDLCCRKNNFLGFLVIEKHFNHTNFVQTGTLFLGFIVITKIVNPETHTFFICMTNMLC